MRARAPTLSTSSSSPLPLCCPPSPSLSFPTLVCHTPETPLIRSRARRRFPSDPTNSYRTSPAHQKRRSLPKAPPRPLHSVIEPSLLGHTPVTPASEHFPRAFAAPRPVSPRGTVPCQASVRRAYGIKHAPAYHPPRIKSVPPMPSQHACACIQR
ncbi:hypothetical protein OF83DRAFT_305617 [Amylostereum chailletii]|nr:hypothetical protein OF83DRAFT_305617 [Amylostereum chailletii]